MKIPPASVTAFREKVYAYYRKNRRVFPWRRTTNRYRILVSEIMLQQTQAARVAAYFDRFISQFPTPHSLASASVAEVLSVWQGLGYNRRALFLHRAAKRIVSEYGGAVPKDRATLLSLPGVGAYTADAVSAFADNVPAVFIETNIRTAHLHHFFPRQKKVSEKNILRAVEATLDRKNPRDWYQALMDYGAFLKTTQGNHNRRSKVYVKQKPFKGSQREVRGALLSLVTSAPLTPARLRRLGVVRAFSRERIRRALRDLSAEGFLQKKNGAFRVS